MTWFGLQWAIHLDQTTADESSRTATVAIGADGVRVSAIGFYVVRALGAAATARSRRHAERRRSRSSELPGEDALVCGEDPVAVWFARDGRGQPLDQLIDDRIKKEGDDGEHIVVRRTDGVAFDLLGVLAKWGSGGGEEAL